MQAQKHAFEGFARIIAAATCDFPVSIHQLPQRIAALRQAKALSQAAMAERLGITEGRYGHYERGFRRFPLNLLPKLVEVLECSEAELLGTPQPKAKRGPPSGWEKRINVIKELPRDKQREIQNVVDALIAKAS
jgi:transcriptional regulator with XRE-family HTH domain